MTDPIVGIDLGTSNTVVAHAATGPAQVLADASGFKIHPSVVSFHPTGGVVVGAAAKQRKVIDPKNTIFSVKRLIGRSWSSPEVQTARKRMPYVIKEGANQLPLIATRGGEFAVPEISAIVLDHAKRVASTALAMDVGRAVVTVPASFNDAQRSATATAGQIAGLTVVRVLNEPTAAALAYGHTRQLRETIAVYDFGGGTFDITILKLDKDVYEVLGTAGDTFLGGDDLDEKLVDRMVEKFLAENRVDLRTNEVSMMRLRSVAEQTKIELSRRPRALVRIDEIAYGPNGKPLDLQIEIRREDFVQYIADIVDRTFPVCEEALRLANLTIDHIDDVVLVGGSTKIPYVREQVSRFFAKAPRTDVNPEEAVATGAALQAMALRALEAPPPARTSTRRAPSRGDHHDVFEERTPPPNAIGRLKTPAKPPPTPKSAVPSTTLRGIAPPAPDLGFPELPTQKDVFEIELPKLAPDDNFPGPNSETHIADIPAAPPPAPPALRPAEPKGFSAPTQSQQIARAPQIMDVTPRSLGIATVAGFCEELIRRNARVPTEMRRLFTTSRDGQDSVRILVCQGEARRLDQNVVIGELKLERLPPRPRGETTIEVTFMLDASGILQVRARDAKTGQETRATLDVVGTIATQNVEAARERVQSLRR